MKGGKANPKTPSKFSSMFLAIQQGVALPKKRKYPFPCYSKAWIFLFKRSQGNQGSIDIYAAQCNGCSKWRVLNTEEEFEEIRHKATEEPFYCNRKPNVSCEDDADINYDATRTWVMDKPNLPKTPGGFKRSLVLRKDYSKLDPYYITPTGKKLRTRNEIAAFLKEHPEFKGVSPSDFDFSAPKIMDETIPEIVGKKDSAKKKTKISKDDA